MMAAGEVDNPLARPRRLKGSRARFGMGPRTFDGPPHGEAGGGAGEPCFEVRSLREHQDRAVESALLALADIMEERRLEQVRVVVSVFQQPSRSRRRVDGIPRMLRREELEERGLEPLARQGEVPRGREAAGVRELAEAMEHVDSA